MASALRGVMLRSGIAKRAAWFPTPVNRIIPSHGILLQPRSDGGLAQSDFVKGYRFISYGSNADKREIDKLEISNSILAEKMTGSSLLALPYDDNCLDYPSEFEIMSSAYSVLKFINRNKDIKSNPKDYMVWGAMYMIYTKFRHYPDVAKLTVMSRVLDVITNYSGIDKIQIYDMRIFIRSMSVNDYKLDLTKDQVASRVLNVVQKHPLVRNRKVVTKESHFSKDLALDKKGYIDVIAGLGMEFKMDIPHDINSCNRAIEYIYKYRHCRINLREYRSTVGFVPEAELESVWEKNNILSSL